MADTMGRDGGGAAPADPFPAPRAVPGASAPRPRRRGLWLTIAALTAVVIVVPAAMRPLTALVQQTSTADWSAAHPVTGVEVRNADGSLTVMPGGPGQVTLHENLTWDTVKPRVTESWRGTTLLVTVDCSPTRPVPMHSCGAELRLSLPADAGVWASTQSGDVVVRGMTGGVHVQVVSGDVTLTATDGTLWARTGSGDITASGLLSRDVEADTVSGSLDLQFAAPPDDVSVSAVSGDATILVPPGALYRVFGRTVSGQRTIDSTLADASSPRAVTVSTVSGDVLVQSQGK